MREEKTSRQDSLKQGREAPPEATLYLETGSTDPAYNLAFEEIVLTERPDGHYLLLWQNDNTVVIGRNQNAEAEIDRSFVEAHHIRVVRRTTGGGAVYHDLGNLNYSFITDVEDADRLTLERFTKPLLAALRGLGLRAEASGRNDILIEGRKVSGTAQRLFGRRILYHGCLLFDSDPAMVAGALRPDPAKLQAKGTKSVQSRIGNIRTFLRAMGRDMDLPAFWQYLRGALAQEVTETQLTPAELSHVAALQRDKYDTWEWNFGRSPQFDVTRAARFAGGSLEVGLSVERGSITRIAFHGDFLGLSSLRPLTAALTGCPYRRETVASVLERFPLPQLFGGIREDEILQVIFGSAEGNG